MRDTDFFTEMASRILQEDVHDYLRKLAKKGIQKIGTADFKTLVGKYGDKQEKDIFGGMDYSGGKSLDVGSLFSGFTQGIRKRIDSEKTAHPYRMETAQSHSTYFPSEVYFELPKTTGKDSLEMKERRTDKLRMRSRKEVIKAGLAHSSRPEVVEAHKQYRSSYELLNKHNRYIDDIHDEAMDKKYFLDTDLETKQQKAHHERFGKTQNELTDKRIKLDALGDDFRAKNKDLKLRNPEEYRVAERNHLGPAREEYSLMRNALQKEEDVFYKEWEPEWKALDAKKADISREVNKRKDEYTAKHITPMMGEHEKKRDLFYKHEDERNLTFNTIQKKYDNLEDSLRKGKGALPLSNYTEHIAQSNLPRPKLTRKGEKPDSDWTGEEYGGGHWGGREGTTEFNVITSDLHHPTYGKTLFVHEIQSDLQQKTRNSSPIAKTWREHALSHVHDLAHKGEYEHVMFAPASVQYVNNGGKATAEEVRSALGSASPEHREQIKKDSGTDNPEALADVLRSGAGDLAKRYHSELFPSANKIFGHEPELHPLGYTRQRGKGVAEKHDFPVYRVEKNIAKMEEEYQKYISHNQLVESVVDSLLDETTLLQAYKKRDLDTEQIKTASRLRKEASRRFGEKIPVVSSEYRINEPGMKEINHHPTSAITQQQVRDMVDRSTQQGAHSRLNWKPNTPTEKLRSKLRGTKPFIMLNPETNFSQREFKAVIGHELGHILDPVQNTEEHSRKDVKGRKQLRSDEGNTQYNSVMGLPYKQPRASDDTRALLKSEGRAWRIGRSLQRVTDDFRGHDENIWRYLAKKALHSYTKQYVENIVEAFLNETTFLQSYKRDGLKKDQIRSMSAFRRNRPGSF